MNSNIQSDMDTKYLYLKNPLFFIIIIFLCIIG